MKLSPLVVCAALSVTAFPVAAQVASPPTSSAAISTLPILSVTPNVLGPDGLVTLRLNSNFAGNARLRIGLFERNRPVRVADVQRDFVAQNGGLQTTLSLRADPGAYELRIVSNDKTRAIASQGAPLLVPGIDSEPGWRLFNGSPFVSSDLAPASPNLPLFLPGIKRDTGKKPRASQNNFVPSSAPLGWKTLPLPPLLEMAQPGFNFNALRANLTRQLQDAQARGERGFAGFLLQDDSGAPPDEVPLDSTRVLSTIRTLRQNLNAIAPDAALIYSPNDTVILPEGAPIYTPGESVSPAALAARAAECDAALFRDAFFAWRIKAARRAAEEEPLYDLPVWIEATSAVPSSNLHLLDFWMSGATGLIHSGAELPDWQPLVARNLPLFVGSVTLEDVGVLPVEESASVRFYALLRASGRVPLMARARDNDNDKNRPPESFLVSVDENTRAATLQSLKDTASAGAILYIEGSVPANSSLAAQMATLGGGTLTPVVRRDSVLNLDDAWFFGTMRGQKLSVQQRVQIKLNQNTTVKKSEKGSDELTAPRVVATLEDGTPGVILNPVGKGEVIWMPHQFKSGQPEAQANYYAAVAGSLQPALVRLSAPDGMQNGQTFSARGLRVAVRRSAKGALLVALLNDSGTANTVQIAVDGAPKTCLDLGLERELTVATRGFEGRTTTTIPARGWTLLAFAETRRALDDERNASRLKATLK